MMTTSHKATPKQWEYAGTFAFDTRACLLELRDRVAALENAANSHSTASDSQVGSSTPDHVRGAPEMVATDDELVDIFYFHTHISSVLAISGLRAIYNHGATKAACPHVRTSDEGTSYCALAEVSAAQARQEEEAAPSPAPAGGLVTRMRSALGMREFLSDAELSSMIHVVADWLQVHSGIIANGSQWGEMLRKEADR